MLEVDVLGPLRVRGPGGDDLTPAGRRERVALALLALASPTVVTTDRIAEELYGDELTSDPRNAVQAVVSRLRKALGRSAGALETHGQGYRLVDLRLDLDRAEGEIAAAGRAHGEQKRIHLTNALALWTDSSLADLPSSDRLDAERFRIEELRAGTQDTLFEHRLSLAADPGLIADLETAIHTHPTREGRWALLMRALYRADRQADALRAFQRARDVLGELGLEPGTALTDLERQILSHDSALDTVTDPRSGEAPLPASAMPSGTVSVLLCDVEGSVRQWEASPDATASNIATMHDIWDAAVAATGGTLVKSTGDGVMAVFHTAADAIHSAVTGQQAHHDDSDLLVRVAIHTGPLTPTGNDYRGRTVNRCARLLELASGGQILVSGTTAALAHELDEDVSVRTLGSHWLRDVPDPIEVGQVHARGIRSDFPNLRSQGPTGLPRLRAKLLGRDELRTDVLELAADTPLVTLLGPGGIGKTSIALAVGWDMAESRNVVFVDLAAVSSEASVPARVADAVSQGEDDRSPVQRLTDRMRINTDLVIIDNAEHVLDAVAQLVDEVLEHDLKGSFIVTSRHPLALPGERVVPVPPLSLPADDDDLVATATTPAVALFLDRARLARPDRDLPTGLLPVVAHICRRLDGIPLAIELAAGRSSVLAVEDIAARLDDQLRLLRQVPVTKERRHRSLEAVVGWSVDHLSPEAQRLFRLLSVFAADFDVRGVEAVMEHHRLEPRDALDHLSELASASLLHVEGGSRFRMLEPIRQFAAVALDDAGDARQARWAHARWLADSFGAAHQLRGPARHDAFVALDDEGDEVKLALARIVVDEFFDVLPDLALGAGWWILTRDPIHGGELLGRVMEAVPAQHGSLEGALTAVGWGIASASHPAEVHTAEFHAAIATLDRHSHPDRGLARIAAAFGHVQAGDIGPAITQLSDAEDHIPADDLWAQAILDMAFMAASSLALMMGEPAPLDLEQAAARGERAAIAFRTFEDRWALGVTLGELGRIQERLGDLESAERSMLESITLFDDTEYHGLHYILTEIAKLASRRGDHDAAAEYHRQAMQIAERDGGSGCLAMTFGGMATSAELRGDIAEAIGLFERALALEAPELKPGVPSLWRSELERLRESAPTA